MIRQLGCDRTRLDQRDAHVSPRDFLSQRLAERTDSELGEIVNP